MNSVGEAIAYYRKKAGLTQAELGEQLFVTYQAVSKWENNLSQPDIDSLKKMAIIFDVSVADLINGNDEAAEKIEIKKDDVPLVSTEKVMLGFCTECGIAVEENTLGELSPKVICKICKVKREARISAEKKKSEETQKAAAERYIVQTQERKRGASRAIIKRSVISGIPAVLFFVLMLVFYDGIYGAFGAISHGIVWAVMTFGYIYQMISKESKLRGIFGFFLGWGIKLPGVIFTLDLDGLIWLILVKILFGVIACLIALLGILLGLAVTLVINIFTFPVQYVKDIVWARY